jgi:hypothetical protein
VSRKSVQRNWLTVEVVIGQLMEVYGGLELVVKDPFDQAMGDCGYSGEGL